MTDSTNITKVPADFYVKLGNSGLKVSKVILGCMGFGSKNWLGDWIEDDEEKIMTVMKAAYDAGIRTFDTADVYSAGLSEIYVGKFIKKFNIAREKIVILSKCNFLVHIDSFSNPPPEMETSNSKGLSRKHILDAVDLSVERLGTYMDLLQIHRYDYDTPEEETMRALNDVVESGKARYIGASSMYAYQFISLQNVAEKNGWHKFISMQNYHNLVYREEEREMIPYCKKTGVALIPWSPIAGGILARPKSELKATDRSKRVNERNESVLNSSNAVIIDRVEELAKKHGVSMAVIATSWSIAKGCFPIVGISKIERIDDLIKAAEFKLSEDDIKYLEEPYKPVAIQGHF